MTNTPTQIGPDKVLDVREIPCSIKHGLILKTWFDRAVGDHFILLNTHDPVPLRNQFETNFPGGVSWEYLERGSHFRIKISKLSAAARVELPSPCQ